MTKKAQGRLFGLLEEDPHHQGSSHEYPDRDGLRRLVDDLRVFDVAEVWTRDDGALALSLTQSDESGDWTQLVDACYRSDGTLARSSATYNTFDVADETSRGASRKRVRYFAPSGALLQTQEQIRDLDTKKPAPRLVFQRMDEPIYKRVRDLPFATLLRR